MTTNQTIEKLVNQKFDHISQKIDEIKKLFNLKNTEFIVDKTILTSVCDTSNEDGIIRCFLKHEEDAVHEAVHAFFDEKNEDMWRKLGEEGFKKNIKNIITNEHLEEVTARIIEHNILKKKLMLCNESQKDVVTFMSKSGMPYENKELGKKIMRLYQSIYGSHCICPKDIKFYNNIKDDTDPMVVYNKLAIYVGTNELI